MHAPFATVPTVQHVAEASVVVANTHKSTEGKPVNENGPQCAHCGWRGGGHASNCPFSAITCTVLFQSLNCSQSNCSNTPTTVRLFRPKIIAVRLL
ncbi:hypothetical protein FB451DRAFT_1564075 [Mycena latifolia]|nr:hypothetical protein FB451DRAFT_1564075 [Mycena latifolia]